MSLVNIPSSSIGLISKMISVVEKSCEKRSIFYFIGLPQSSPRLLIPLAARRVQFRAFSLYNPVSIKGKLFKLLGKTAVITGILNLAGRFFAAPVETFRVTENIKPILNNRIINWLQNDWASALGKIRFTFALSLGDPNFFRKVTVIFIDDQAKPIAFSKVGCTSQTKAQIANEAIALGEVESLKCQSVVIPLLLGRGETANISWILQSPLLSGHLSSNALQNEHVVFLSELAQKSVQVIPLDSSDVWKYLQILLKSPVLPVKAGFESERPFVEQLCTKINALHAGDVNKPWPFTIAHGDFAPWNMRLIDGKIALYDWEYFLPLAPAGWDIFYFIFRVENLIKLQSLEQIWSKIESGAYLESLELWEKQAGIQVPDRRLLARFVLISIALDLVPKWICRENDL